jgi:hypothetical protein
MNSRGPMEDCKVYCENIDSRWAVEDGKGNAKYNPCVRAHDGKQILMASVCCCVLHPLPTCRQVGLH